MEFGSSSGESLDDLEFISEDEVLQSLSEEADPTVGYTTKFLRQSSRLLFASIGVHASFQHILVKLKKMCDSFNCTFFLQMFAQSLSIGFEKKVSEMVERSKANRAAAVLSETHEAVRRDIFDRNEAVKKSFFETFSQALEIKLAGLRKKDQILAERSFSGDDFLFDPSKNSELIRRRFRAFGSPSVREVESGGFAADLYADYFKADIAVAAISAFGSAVFVQIDTLGRFLGGEIAKVMIMACSILPKVGEIDFAKESMGTIDLLAKNVMAALYLGSEVTKFLADWGKVLAFGAVESLYFPVVSGVMISLYGELSERLPEAVPKLIAERKGEVDGNAISLGDKSLWEIIKISYEKARHKYEKFDKTFDEKREGLSEEQVDDERMRRLLVKNSASAKRFLVARQAFLRIFKNHPWKEKYLLPIVLTLRASPLMVSAFVSKIAFDTSKFYSAGVSRIVFDAAKFYTDLGASLIKYPVGFISNSFSSLFSKDASGCVVQPDVVLDERRDAVDDVIDDTKGFDAG